MKPKTNSKNLLSISQSIAKMIEFHVPEDDRQLRTAQKPEKLFSISIGLLGDYARLINTDYENPQKKDLQSDLLYSAEFLESYANSNLDKNPIYELLVGAAAYYLCDLPGSSQVLINKIPENYEYEFNCSNLDHFLYWLLKNDYQNIPDWDCGIYNSHVLMLSFYFHRCFNKSTEEKLCINIANSFRKNAYIDGNSRELFFSELITSIIIEKIKNSCLKLLPLYSNLQSSVWLPIINNGLFIKELWPSQKLLGENGVFQGKSAVVQMPTSSGKTKSIEIIIRSGFYSERASIAVIVAPFKALCSEITEELRYSFSNDTQIDINQLNDAFENSEQSLFFSDSKKHILVVTPEKLYYLLSLDKSIANTIGLIIFDEGHQFDNGSRGITYELLITELKVLLPESSQKVLISAVIHNASEIASWLMPDSITITSSYVPTKKNIGFIDFSIGPSIRFIDSVTLKEKYFVPRVLPALHSTKNPLLRNISPTNISLYMAFKMVMEGSVAVFCGQKKSVTKIMRDTISAMDLSPEEFNISSLGNLDEINKIGSLCNENLGSESLITKSCTKGIFPHHADIPKGIRAAIEFGMRKSLIKFVVCTSTLAQGINLPIRYMFVNNTYQAGGEISVRDFNNLIGRVGRAGKLTEGCIIFTDPEIYKYRNNPYENIKWRKTTKLLDPNQSEDCLSNILNILQNKNRYGENILQSINVDSFVNQYYESTPEEYQDIASHLIEHFNLENVSVRDLVSQMNEKLHLIKSIENFLMVLGDDLSDTNVELVAKNTLAYSLADDETKEVIIRLFSLIKAKILSQIEDISTLPIFAKSLSGIDESKIISSWLSDNHNSLIQTSSITDFITSIWPLIIGANKNSYFQFYEDKASLLNALLLWIEGKPYFEIFSYLPKLKVNKRDTLTIEHVINIFENGFGYDVPILINCITELLSLYLEEDEYKEICTKLHNFQKIIKYGLPETGAILLYEEGFCDRTICQKINSILGNPDNRSELFHKLVLKDAEISLLLQTYPSYFYNHYCVLIHKENN